MNWYEEAKQDFTKNISDSYTLNLAMSILEDRKNLLNDNLDLQNNWNELKKWLEEYLQLFDEPDSYEEQTIEDLKEVLSKMQDLEQKCDKTHEN